MLHVALYPSCVIGKNLATEAGIRRRFHFIHSKQPSTCPVSSTDDYSMTICRNSHVHDHYKSEKWHTDWRARGLQWVTYGWCDSQNFVCRSPSCCCWKSSVTWRPDRVYSPRSLPFPENRLARILRRATASRTRNRPTHHGFCTRLQCISVPRQPYSWYTNTAFNLNFLSSVSTILSDTNTFEKCEQVNVSQQGVNGASSQLLVCRPTGNIRRTKKPPVRYNTDILIKGLLFRFRQRHLVLLSTQWRFRP